MDVLKRRLRYIAKVSTTESMIKIEATQLQSLAREKRKTCFEETLLVEDLF